MALTDKQIFISLNHQNSQEVKQQNKNKPGFKSITNKDLLRH